MSAGNPEKKNSAQRVRVRDGEADMRGAVAVSSKVVTHLRVECQRNVIGNRQSKVVRGDSDRDDHISEVFERISKHSCLTGG
jgi:hypothetical protein